MKKKSAKKKATKKEVCDHCGELRRLYASPYDDQDCICRECLDILDEQETEAREELEADMAQ